MRERQWLKKQLRRGSLPCLNYTDRFGVRSNVLSRKKVTNQLISVEINGERREIPASLNVRGLLEHLQIDKARVAVELNKEIVRKTAWDATPVETGAQIEIVMFVGGGKF